MDKKRDAQKYCQDGRLTRNQNELTRAVVSFTRAIKLNKTKSDYLFEMANTVGSQDKFKEATVLYKMIGSMDPNNSLVFFNSGYAFQMMGKDDDSIKMYKKALDLNPNYGDVCYNLANVLIMQGKYEEAHKYYTKVLELQPADDYLVYNCLGYSYFLQGEFAKAIEELKKSISLNEKDPFAYCNMSLVLFCEEKSEEALKYFEGGLKVLEGEECPRKVFEEIIRSYVNKKTSFEVELNKNNEILSEAKRILLRTMVNGLIKILDLLTKSIPDK